MDLYKDCSYDATGFKTSPVPGVTNRNIGTKKPIFKILLFLKPEGVEIWYFVCGISLGTSTKFVHKIPIGSELAPPWVSQVEHRNKERKFYNSSLKLDGLELWYFVCSISLGTSTKFVNEMPLGLKPTPPWGSQVEHRNMEQTFYNSSSLKLDDLELWYFLYVASPCGPLPSSFIWCPKGQDWSCPGSHKLEYRNKEDKFQIFLLWKWKAYSFDIWYVASPPNLFIWCPWGQNWPRPGGHMLEHRSKDGKLQNSSLKLEGTELWYLVCSISLWTSTKFVHMIPLG